MPQLTAALRCGFACQQGGRVVALLPPPPASAHPWPTTPAAFVCFLSSVQLCDGNATLLSCFMCDPQGADVQAGSAEEGYRAAGSSTTVSLLPALLRSQGRPVLQLAAAWHQLAARLPPQAGTGPSAELILNALKLALAYADGRQEGSAAGVGGDGRPAAERALSLASLLAELSAAGLPLDAEAIAAGILAEVLGSSGSSSSGSSGSSGSGSSGSGSSGSGNSGSGSSSSSGASWGMGLGSSSSGGGAVLTLEVVEQRVGPLVAQLAHDVQRVHALPSRVDLCDDQAARWAGGGGEGRW